MKSSLTLFVICLSFAFVANAQPKANSPAPGSTPTQAVQSSELSEAARLNAQVVKLYGESKYDEALPLAEKVLDIRERKLGGEHDQTIAALVNLAATSLAAKKYKDSLPLYERLLAFYEKKYGANDLKLVPVINALAVARYAQDDYGKVEELYSRALLIRESKLGAEHTDVAQSLYNLAEFYHLREKYGKAEPLYQRAIAIWEKMMPKTRAVIAEALEHFIVLSVKMKNEKQADALQSRLQEILTVTPDASNAGGGANGDGRTVDGGILTGRALAKVAPEYPLVAQQERAYGTVVVQIVVDESGRVIEAKALNGHIVLKAAAERAAKQWRFTPTRLEGRPVRVTGTITFNFVPR